MRIVKICCFTAILFFEAVAISYAGGIKKVWEITFGNGENQISVPQEDEFYYDFEVYGGKLFLCDNEKNEIKILDSSGKYVGSIKLPDEPEIIKMWDSTLVVLIDNGQLGLYDLRTEKLNVMNLRVEIKPYSYSEAFFSDSLLFIPKEDRFISISSDAYVIDISKLPRLEISIQKNAYNIEREISWSDSVIERGKKYSIQQSDFCFDSKNVSIMNVLLN
jgi:hypothetical protein